MVESSNIHEARTIEELLESVGAAREILHQYFSKGILELTKPGEETNLDETQYNWTVQLNKKQTDSNEIHVHALLEPKRLSIAAGITSEDNTPTTVCSKMKKKNPLHFL